jgi:hypothetical protein
MARFAVDVVFTYKATFLVEADSHHNAKVIVADSPNLHPKLWHGKEVFPANTERDNGWSRITIGESEVLDKAQASATKPRANFPDYGDDGEE